MDQEVFVASDLGEELLATAYLLLQKDELLDVVFYSGAPKLSEFLGWLKRPDCRCLGGFVRSMSNVGHTVELAAFGAIWDISGPPGGRRGSGHFVALKKFWHNRLPERLAGQMVDYAFEACELDVVYVVTPTTNRAIRLMTRRLGFTWLGPFPKWGVVRGQPGDAMIGHLTKEVWGARSNQSTVW